MRNVRRGLAIAVFLSAALPVRAQLVIDSLSGSPVTGTFDWTGQRDLIGYPEEPRTDRCVLEMNKTEDTYLCNWLVRSRDNRGAGRTSISRCSSSSRYRNWRFR